MKEKKLKNEPNLSAKNDSASDEKSSMLSRRKFIQIGAATLTISFAGGGLFELLSSRRKKPSSFQASSEKPNKNPAFAMQQGKDGAILLYSRTSDGRTLRHELNNVGAALYMACDGERTRNEIIHNAANQLAKDMQAFRPEAQKFLVELEKENLIVTKSKVNLFYTRVVRYEQS